MIVRTTFIKYINKGIFFFFQQNETSGQEDRFERFLTNESCRFARFILIFLVFAISQNTPTQLLSSFVSASARLINHPGRRLFLERRFFDARSPLTEKATCSLTADDRWERKNVTQKAQFRYTPLPISVQRDSNRSVSVHLILNRCSRRKKQKSRRAT